MKIICPVCNDNNVSEQNLYRGNSEIFKGLSRLHCNECGMVFANPMPDNEQLEKYNNSYFLSAHGGRPENKYVSAFFSAISRLRLEYVLKYLNKNKLRVMSVFEVGPGLGYFAQHWLEKFPGSNYFAFETDVSCHEDLKNIGVNLLRSLHNFKEQKVDLVVMSHVLEHVTDPVNFIETMTEVLSDNGVLFIEVPCQDWEHKALDEPHLLFFDKSSMSKLLLNLNYTDIQLSYHGSTIRSLKSNGITNKFYKKWQSLRARLISLGFVRLFSGIRPGMEALNDPHERASVAPHNAHKEQEQPSWWLRAVAIKKGAR